MILCWSIGGHARMAPSTTVTVEFFGVPRHRAGRREVTLAAGTVREVLDALEAACPGLRGLRDRQGHLSGHYLLSIDGQSFVEGLDTPLTAGQRLLLLSADAGG